MSISMVGISKGMSITIVSISSGLSSSSWLGISRPLAIISVSISMVGISYGMTITMTISMAIISTKTMAISISMVAIVGTGISTGFSLTRSSGEKNSSKVFPCVKNSDPLSWNFKQFRNILRTSLKNSGIVGYISGLSLSNFSLMTSRAMGSLMMSKYSLKFKSEQSRNMT